MRGDQVDSALFVVILLAATLMPWFRQSSSEAQPQTKPQTVLRVVSLVMAWVVFVVTLFSPLAQSNIHHWMGGTALLYTLQPLVGVPLLLTGLPPTFDLAQRLRKRRLNLLVHPMLALVLFNTAYSLAFHPFLVNWSMQSFGHTLITLAVLDLFAILLWWPVVHPSEANPVSDGPEVLYLLGNKIASMPIGFVLLGTQTRLYPIPTQPPVHGLFTLMVDQQLAAAVIFSVPLLIFSVAAAAVFLRWFSAQRQHEHEGHWAEVIPLPYGESMNTTR
ncbi:MAG: cytochrome c oxidase assembly protein [Firmicutes bacterium]|nr:cytochrome c oxidase assembly protein [Bacillota bacterium]